MALSQAAEQALERAAQHARSRSYAPYSQFRVGAALQLDDGRIITGGNVENASYGLTLCAERSALVAAVAQGATKAAMQALVVVADAPRVAAPCGACRQVLFELCPAAMPITLLNIRDEARLKTHVAALLPHGFGPEMLACKAP